MIEEINSLVFQFAQNIFIGINCILLFVTFFCFLKQKKVRLNQLLFLYTVINSFLFLILLFFIPINAICSNLFIISALALFGYYFIPSLVGMLFFIVTGIFLWLCWKEKPRTRVRIILFSISSISMCCYLIYVLWWYLTGQKLQYL